MKIKFYAEFVLKLSMEYSRFFVFNYLEIIISADGSKTIHSKFNIGRIGQVLCFQFTTYDSTYFVIFAST